MPLAIAAGSLGFCVWSPNRRATLARLARQKEAESAFQLEAAEIIMDTDGPRQAQNRARALRKFFPKRLPEDLAQGFVPEEFGIVTQLDEGKKELLRLIAEHPAAKQQILELWAVMFQGDPWLKHVLRSQSVTLPPPVVEAMAADAKERAERSRISIGEIHFIA